MPATGNGPALTRRLLELVSAPGRWLERSRGLTRLNLALLAALLLAGVLGLILREASLNGLPDIGHPFDLATLTDPDIPDDQNAFTLYRQAARQFRVDPNTGSMPADIQVRGAIEWIEVPAQIQLWHLANREALDLWRQGTDRAEGYDQNLTRPDPETGRALASDLRALAMLGLLEAARLENSGDLEGAWDWYRAVLRSSRHVMQHAGWTGREIGNRIDTSTREPILAWAQKGIARHLFPRAIADLTALDAMTPSADSTLRYEYLEQRAALDDAFASAPDLTTRIDWFVLNEPRKSRRVLSLIWANWLAEITRPIAARPDPIHRDPHLFDDPEAPPEARRLPALDLLRWYEGSALADRDLPTFELCNEPFYQRRQRAEFVVEIARLWYFLDYGFPPLADEELLGTHLTRFPAGYDGDHL